MIEGHKLRQKLLRSGLNPEATEIYVYIDQVTKRGEKGADVFDEKSLVNRVEIAFLKMFDGFQPHIENLERLYDDPEYRQKWLDNYHKDLAKVGLS